MDRGNGPGAGGPGAGNNRAERFEDEKRRIVDTCFSKKDPDGSLQETYITHIRIVEYSSHPAAPPPPAARTPESEKARVIIIAVRKSGRVRMHKSKENANGSFSIGKTWNLDDLTRIESYTGPNVEPNLKDWAGDTGFLVTLGKPYYWNAQTDKEKKFFIASMVKIYGKYTQGKTPEMVGFDQKELDQVLGAGKRPAVAPPRPAPIEHRPSTQSAHSGYSSATATGAAPSPAPTASPQPAASLAPQEVPPRFHQKTPPVRSPPSGTGSPAGSIDSTASRERLGMRKIASNNKSQESVAASFATRETRDTRSDNRSDDASSLPPRSRNGMPGPGAFGRFGDGRGEASEPPSQPLPQPPSNPSSRPRTPKDGSQPPPERRRPPMDPTRPLDRDLVPPPLMAPSQKREPMAQETPPPRDPVAPPPRSSERMSPRKDSLSYRPGTAQSLASSLQDRSTPPPSMTPKEMRSPEQARTDSPKPDRVPFKSPSNTSLPKNEIPVASPPEEPTQPPAPPPDPEEDARPGLGPMIKSKRSKGEIAGAFRKAASAATAASAFKPRPGGAGERLRLAAQAAQASQKSDEPDGITGVVPAPPRPVSRGDRPVSRGTREPTPEPVPPPKAPQRTSNVPEVKISVPQSSSRPNSQGQPREVPKEAAQAQEEAPKPPPRKSVVASNDAKYLQSLGIDPNLLDGRSEDFGQWLDHFGWIPGTQMQTRNIDDMKTDLERELNKAQAGGWLARFQEEDERVDAIKLGIDVAMTECEELDNLLTLYSVELSVSKQRKMTRLVS